MRKFKKIVIFALAIACVFSFAACGVGGGGSVPALKTVKKLQIVEGSFKENYQLNEALNLDTAKLLLTYSDLSAKLVDVTADMISGFDTATTGQEKVMTIKHAGLSTTAIYRVAWSEVVESAVRVTATQEKSATTTAIKVAIEGVSAEANGVFALSFNAKIIGATYVNATFKLPKDVAFKEKYENNILKLLVYSKDGAAKMADGLFVTINFKNVLAKSSVSLENIKLSDGESDKRLPSVTVTFEVE